MISLEQQVVSLELAKRLKELRVKQESFVFWNESADGWGLRLFGELRGVTEEVYSAFTVAELGLLLIPHVGQNLPFYDSWEKRWMFTWNVHFISEAEADTEADARAKALIYLLENKLVTL
jgi:hypothetical protein